MFPHMDDYPVINCTCIVFSVLRSVRFVTMDAMSYETTIHAQLKVSEMQVGLFFVVVTVMCLDFIFSIATRSEFFLLFLSPIHRNYVSQVNPEHSIAAIHFRQLEKSKKYEKSSSEAGRKPSISWEATAYTVNACCCYVILYIYIYIYCIERHGDTLLCVLH